MSFARHGHSCCTIMDRYIIVSGSRKEINGAAHRVELYDILIDEWLELPRINDGRHYHSSCHFGHKFVYIFGGIQNSNKKYSGSIERLAFDLTNLQRPWDRVNLAANIKPNVQITARQGAGMCQVSDEEIVIVGGFNGKFLNDYYTLQYDPASGEPRKIYRAENVSMSGTFTLFPFQVPTLGDVKNKQAITVDWQTMALYRMQNNTWKYVQHIKNSGNHA